MRRWERRLADLAHLLGTCSSTYFEPELFRLNVNQFLTTARTVTFLIQKEKMAIPDFEKWYASAVLRPWGSDPVMGWAKDSRNHIEKEGDLDLHSRLSVTLIYSYIESEDIRVSCSRAEVLSANIKRLTRFAEKQLPSGVADASVLKIERRWVANTLPERELLQALIYVFSRIRVAAASLAIHLGTTLPGEIPDATDFDELQTGDQRTTYIKFAERRASSFVSSRVLKNPKYQPPPWLSALAADRPPSTRFKSLADRVAFFSELAQGTFEQFGNHVPMLYLFDSEGAIVDFLGLVADDQATKFIFWRKVADRITYLRAESLVYVTEVWIRTMDKHYSIPVRKMPIRGEMLNVIGLESSGGMETVMWDIKRETPEAKPVLLSRPSPEPSEFERAFNFLRPARRAFAQLYEVPK